jgi:hypothetical protein
MCSIHAGDATCLWHSGTGMVELTCCSTDKFLVTCSLLSGRVDPNVFLSGGFLLYLVLGFLGCFLPNELQVRLIILFCASRFLILLASLSPEWML